MKEARSDDEEEEAAPELEDNETLVKSEGEGERDGDGDGVISNELMLYEDKEDNKPLESHDLSKALIALQKEESEKALAVDMNTLSDIDDSEIEKMILSKEEREFKTRVWNHLNKDWISEQKVKKRKKKEMAK